MPYADPDKQREYQRKWNARKRAKFMAGKSCEKCGTTAKLNLHHKDKDKKTEHRIWTWEENRIREEMAKCEILCARCHQRLHHLKPTEHGMDRMYRRGCRCGKCRAANTKRCMDYRHKKQGALD